MSDVLEKINAVKRAAVAKRKERTSLAALEAKLSSASPPRGFAAAICRRPGELRSAPALPEAPAMLMERATRGKPACSRGRRPPADLNGGPFPHSAVNDSVMPLRNGGYSRSRARIAGLFARQ